jgi:hypothetical protein
MSRLYMPGTLSETQFKQILRVGVRLLGSLCKSRMGRMRLLCIVQSRMRHHAAFVSLSIIYLILV